MTHGDGGKGSTQRPTNYDSFAENFDRIFKQSKDPAFDESILEKITEDDEEPEDDICSWCSGSGEGMYDGATCSKCKGSGIEPVDMDDDV